MTKSYQICGFFGTLFEAKKSLWTPFQASTGLSGRHGFGTRMGPLGQRVYITPFFSSVCSFPNIIVKKNQ